MKKINVAEILRNCPEGMELDCALWDNVTFKSVGIDSKYPIIITHQAGEDVYLTEYGCWNRTPNAKCVIFPKGKTSWEGFQRPFNDGDVVAACDGVGVSSQLFLLKRVKYREDNNGYDGYCYFGWDFLDNRLFEEGNWGFNRLATEEEKQQLFDAIKDNGYRWDDETKTLEKLIESKEDVNDEILMSIYFDRKRYADEVELHLNDYNIEIRDGRTYAVLKELGQNKFKVGDKIRKKGENSTFTITDVNESHYFCGKYVICDTCDNNWELVPNKFDITTLKPYDKVLVRLTKDNAWNATFFSHYDKEVKWGCYPFVTTSSKSYSMCIPFEGNEHLTGKTDDCDNFYKIWE